MLALWLVSALLLFWTVGAYNRLIRLRARALQAFGAFDGFMARLIALIDDYRAARGVADAPAQADAHAALDAAAAQFGASLAVARERPLDAGAAAALAAGAHVLETAWQTVARNPPEGAEAFAPWLREREDLALQSVPAQEQFNAAVTRYNHAIAQFPASLLAWLIGLRPAQTL